MLQTNHPQFNYTLDRWYFQNNFKQAKQFLLEALDYFLPGQITYNTVHGAGFVKRPDPEPHSLGSTINEKRQNLKHLVEGFGTGSLPAKDLYFHLDLYKDGQCFFTISDSLEESYLNVDDQTYNSLKKFLKNKNLPDDLIHHIDQIVCVPITCGLGKWLKARRYYSPKEYKLSN